MLEINWNIFKAKFNGKEQEVFENLSYLLFCDEFNKDTGIFRYKNQTGIETEPIEHEGKIIGFQAKFYETKISDKVKDIEDSIAKAKNKNPNLNKILFYINQEFSESNKKGQKEPQYKIEIDNFAAGKGIEIEWRVPSHFERQLALENNISLGKHFFALDKSTFDLVQDLIKHTESILTPIRSDIEFKGNVIKLDRSATLADLKIVLAKSSVVILSGKGGVGKTAVIKDFYRQVKETIPMFVFK
ncbi:MAG: ATP-binding protein, partial [Bacillota bacterium]|nr:ATP-binding protein [Bacillota bacterium]